MPASSSPPEPTLSNITKMGREAVKYIIVGLLVLILGRMLLTGLVRLWKTLNPEPPPPPTVGFGKLPVIEFPKQEASEPKSYTLETADGKLPYFSDRAKVFFMPQSSPNLLSDERAKEIAASYDFIFEPTVLNERTYRWIKSLPLESSLQMDIQTFNFKLSSDYLTRPELLVNVLPPEKRTAERLVKNFLQRNDLLGEDIATASAETRYLKFGGDGLEEAVSVSDADFIEVNLNRVPIDDEYFIYTPKANQGTVRAVLTGVLDSEDSIVELEYHYQAADYSQVETYPLKEVKLAWQELQAGEAFIVDSGEKEEAVVRDVYLAYFDSFEEQAYLQPIYVFSGDDGFLAYVSALDSRYISQD